MYDFVFCDEESPAEFVLVSNFPRKVYALDSASEHQTLEDAGIETNAMLFVQNIEEESDSDWQVARVISTINIISLERLGTKLSHQIDWVILEIHGKKLPLQRMIIPEETGFLLFENKAMESSVREINLHFRLSTTEEKANYFLNLEIRIFCSGRRILKWPVVVKIIPQSLCDILWPWEPKVATKMKSSGIEILIGKLWREGKPTVRNKGEVVPYKILIFTKM